MVGMWLPIAFPALVLNQLSFDIDVSYGITMMTTMTFLDAIIKIIN